MRVGVRVGVKEALISPLEKRRVVGYLLKRIIFITLKGSTIFFPCLEVLGKEV